MELFAKIVNSSRGVFRTESNMSDGTFCINSERLKKFFSKISILDVRLCFEYTYGIVNYFRQNMHLESLIRSEYSSLPVLSLEILNI